MVGTVLISSGGHQSRCLTGMHSCVKKLYFPKYQRRSPNSAKRLTKLSIRIDVQERV